MSTPATRWPEPNPRPFVPIAKIEPEKKYSFLILSHRVFAFDLHYTGERHKPCTKHLGECWLCGSKSKARWTGYLGVYAPVQRMKLLVAITLAAAQNCPDLQTLDGSLRGKFLLAARMGSTKQTGLNIRIVETDTRYKLPAVLPEVDVLSALARWWDCPIEALILDGTETEPPCP